MDVGINQLCSRVNAVECNATGEHLDRVLAPQKVLAYIVDFLTRGSVRRSNQSLYDQLRNAFENLRMFSYELPFSLQSDTCVLGEIGAHTASIILPGINHPEGPVTVRIGSGNTRQEICIERNDIKHPVLSEIIKERLANMNESAHHHRACLEETAETPMNRSIRYPSGIVVGDPLFSDV